MNGLNRQTDKRNILKALGLTMGTTLLLAWGAFLIHWSFLPPKPPVLDNGIEVNLGFGDEGIGDIAPMIPGEPAPEILQQEAAGAMPQSEPIEEKFNNAPSKTAPGNEIPVYKDVVKNNDKQAPVIKTTTQPSVSKTKSVIENVAVTVPPKNKVSAPAAGATVSRTPKALYRGGSGSGGNHADSYNGVRNQGIAGGNGDQGGPNGNPNSNNYTGNGGSGNAGVSIREGLSGRRIIAYPSNTDKFNENARVAVKIVVDEAGNVSSASINPNGTTTANAQIRRIALTKAKQLRFNKSATKVQSGTILFNFKLNG